MAKGTRLEIGRAPKKCSVGSNPTPSASLRSFAALRSYAWHASLRMAAQRRSEDCPAKLSEAKRRRAANRVRSDTWHASMERFYYVYIIVSKAKLKQYYIGFTENLQDRLKHHNAGAVPSTAPYRPWEYRTYTAFTSRERALEFERYLKSHSGRAFLAKRL